MRARLKTRQTAPPASAQPVFRVRKVRKVHRLSLGFVVLNLVVLFACGEKDAAQPVFGRSELHSQSMNSESQYTVTQASVRIDPDELSQPGTDAGVLFLGQLNPKPQWALEYSSVHASRPKALRLVIYNKRGRKVKEVEIDIPAGGSPITLDAPVLPEPGNFEMAVFVGYEYFYFPPELPGRPPPVETVVPMKKKDMPWQKVAHVEFFLDEEDCQEQEHRVDVFYPLGQSKWMYRCKSSEPTARGTCVAK